MSQAVIAAEPVLGSGPEGDADSKRWTGRIYVTGGPGIRVDTVALAGVHLRLLTVAEQLRRASLTGANAATALSVGGPLYGQALSASTEAAINQARNYAYRDLFAADVAGLEQEVTELAMRIATARALYEEAEGKTTAGFSPYIPQLADTFGERIWGHTAALAALWLPGKGSAARYEGAFQLGLLGKTGVNFAFQEGRLDSVRAAAQLNEIGRAWQQSGQGITHDFFYGSQFVRIAELSAPQWAALSELLYMQMSGEIMFGPTAGVALKQGDNLLALAQVESRNGFSSWRESRGLPATGALFAWGQSNGGVEKSSQIADNLFAAQPYLVASTTVPFMVKGLIGGEKKPVTALPLRTIPTGVTKPAAPIGAAATLSRLSAVPAPGPGGAIEIIKRTTGPGKNSWQVLVPGTRNWTLGGPNPQDLQTNLEMMSGLRSDQHVAVRKAMEIVGIEPGDPVELVGHSQGGAIVTQLAGDPDFSRRFNVVSLLTAGAPAGGVTLPSHTQALHLANTEDIVPALDGTPNSSAANSLTVLADGRGLAAGADKHGLPLYVSLAAQLPELSDPGVKEWVAARQAQLDTPSSQATSYLIETVRVSTQDLQLPGQHLPIDLRRQGMR